jgi:hypothetical protein
MSTEPELWNDADDRAKSHLVQVLHWFHFRPRALKGSWQREEVLTWELIRALDLLPVESLLGPLLQALRGTSDSVGTVTECLLARLPNVAVTPYPSLQMNGAQRNCRADIGFVAPDGAQLWVEVKTSRAAMRDLAGQIRLQADALQRIASPSPAAVVALLPDGAAALDVPSVSWSAVRHVLAAALDGLPTVIPSPGLRRGYERVARELDARIASHPGCTPPNKPLQPTGFAGG